MMPTTLRPLAAFGLVLALMAAVSACAGQPPAAPTAEPASVAPPANEVSEQVQIFQGTHTVRHSTAPLPSADQPREDGRNTLVWFSATW